MMVIVPVSPTPHRQRLLLYTLRSGFLIIYGALRKRGEVRLVRATRMSIKIFATRAGHRRQRAPSRIRGSVACSAPENKCVSAAAADQPGNHRKPDVLHQKNAIRQG
jgi:hypothetical protein